MSKEKTVITPVSERLDCPGWLSVFDEKGTELDVVWVSMDHIGFRENEKIGYQETFIVSLRTEFAGLTDPMGLKNELHFIESEQGGNVHVYHIGAVHETDLTLWKLIYIAKIKNQSDTLDVHDVFRDMGMEKWENIAPSSKKGKKKKKPLSNVVGNIAMSLIALCLVIWISVFFNKSDSGTFATAAQRLEITTKGGVSIESVVKEGDLVRKGQILAYLENPRILGDLTLLNDRVSDAKKKTVEIEKGLSAIKSEIQNQSNILANAIRTHQAYLTLSKEGGARGLDVLDKDSAVSKARTDLDRMKSDEAKLLLEQRVLQETWGRDFSKVNNQIASLKKQIRGLEVRSNCNCRVYRIDTLADLTAFVLYDPSNPAFLEVTLSRARAADLTLGQKIEYKTSNGEFKTGIFTQIQINPMGRVGVADNMFASIKDTVIRVIPVEPIVIDEVNSIGKPITIIMPQNSLPTMLKNFWAGLKNNLFGFFGF